MKTSLLRSIRSAKRLVIVLIGFTVLAIGVPMIVPPGPAMVVIPVGLVILKYSKQAEQGNIPGVEHRDTMIFEQDC